MSEPVKRNTPEEIIAVVQAFLRGQAIQYAQVGSRDAHADYPASDDPGWDFHRIHYRPKPREFWVNVYPAKHGVPKNHAVHESPEEAHGKRTCDCIETIHMREVL